MHKLLQNIWLMSLVLITCVNLSPAAQAEDLIRVGGAGTGLGVVKILAGAFEKAHPGTKIKVLPNLGSSGGIKALLHGAIDVAISGRALNGEELKAGGVAVECARTPFILVVNKYVKKADMTKLEMEMIYNGQMQKWPDGTRIRLILRPEGDTDTMILRSISKGMERGVTASNSRPNMILAVTDQEAVDTVVNTPGALGASTLAQVETEKEQVKVLSFDGVRPTAAALAKGSYPLAKPIYMVSTAKTPATALQFIRFARSTKGRAILARSGAMPAAGE